MYIFKSESSRFDSQLLADYEKILEGNCIYIKPKDIEYKKRSGNTRIYTHLIKNNADKLMFYYEKKLMGVIF